MRLRSFGHFVILWLLVIAGFSIVSACGDLGDGEKAADDDTADDDADDDAADDDSSLTYTNFAKGFFGEYCLYCHGEPLEEDVPFHLDTYDRVTNHLDEIKLQAVELKAMPPDDTPGDFPSDAEREKLGEWIDAGAPE